MLNYFYLFIINVLVDNFILVQFLGICPLMGVSQKLNTAVGMSVTTTIVITVTSILSWIINYFILIPYQLCFLRVMVYILIIAVSVQCIEIFLKKTYPILYKSLGIFLPLITTNCSVLAIPLLSVKFNYNFLESVIYGFSSAIGFSIVIIIFSSIRERIKLSNIPIVFKGVPIALITVSLMSISFMGFDGLVKL
ncbi:Ion-translocating oxidoreductase complex subunit A [Buchnera aphidicola (Eriosoma grossulariae)]|uniref:electron transport complex subunit RsxA n=1 Tax=Buchnera aphidicola TaxID=9 RepID=UPI003463CAB9